MRRMGEEMRRMGEEMRRMGEEMRRMGEEKGWISLMMENVENKFNSCVKT